MDKVIEEMCRESFGMLDSGDIDGALRLSGEALASADSSLARVKAGQNYDADATLMRACAAHTSILLAAGMAPDAFSCCVMTACIADSRGDFVVSSLAGDCAGLIHGMIMSAMAAVDSLPPADTVRDNAVALISLAGHVYLHISDKTGQRDNALMDLLGPLCGQARNAIIDGKEVPPSETKTFLAEIIRLGADLGILRV